MKLKHFFSDRFNLNEDKADEQLIIESIKRDVNFKGTNLWTLIFAIFIASIGLNVNSTAVIIGAMLISPLMGPIMGIGLGIGINDFELLKRGVKNLLIATIISIAVSSLYFAISPLHDASSELLARTTPSLWDVFIAFFGGLAGIVAGTRKEKSNVIPGVAIATALMPPLCTAGFGLATGRWVYFIGAMYLFFINSLFICLATFLIVKHLKFHKKELATPEQERRMARNIMIIVVITVLPSIYLAYRIARQSIFESNAKKFITTEFHFPKTQVVTSHYLFDEHHPSIELLLVGQPLSIEFLDTIKHKLSAYHLDSARLIVHQGLDAKQKIDLSEIKASVLEDLFAAEHAGDSITVSKEPIPQTLPDIKDELIALYPSIRRYSIGPSVFIHADTTGADSLITFVCQSAPPLPSREKVRLRLWLKHRLQTDSVKCVFE